MAKNDANKEGVFLGPPRTALTTVSVQGTTEVVSGKRPVSMSTRLTPGYFDTPYGGEKDTGQVRPTRNMKPR